MTDTTLAVKLDDLTDLAGKLSTVSQHLGEATGRLRGGDHVTAGDVDGALDDFADHWDYGLGQIRKTLDGLHDALGVAVGAYGDHERDLAASYDAATS